MGQMARCFPDQQSEQVKRASNWEQPGIVKIELERDRKLLNF